jgi:ribokinase
VRLRPVRLAVVGHVEWVEFVRVSRLPVTGQITHAESFFEEAAGGGGVAAVRLSQLSGRADFFTALGRDGLGQRAHEQLSSQGVRVHATWVDAPQRRAITFVDGEGERTITVIGERVVPRGSDPLPWGELVDADAVYFTGGDVEALRAARAARVLVATPRVLGTLREGAVQLDALVGSGLDPGEAYQRGDLSPPPTLYVATAGADGGAMDPGGTFPAAPLPGPVVDTYGAGDSFAAALTYALARGWSSGDAVSFAARCGAAAITTPGAYAGRPPAP